MIDQSAAAPYGGAPFPGIAAQAWTGRQRFQAVVTGLFVMAPFAGLAVAVAMLWGHGIGLADVLLAVAMYTITGFGVTAGFHRLITHRSFTARPWLRITLAIAEPMSFQGDVIGWVAIHRRHHAFTCGASTPCAT